MSKKLVINFTTDELKKLIDDKTSCVTVHKSVYSLQLYPYHLSDIGASIKELLNAKVAKYDKILNGILLGYKNLKLLTPQGTINCDSCYIHIEIEGDFYIFKPKIDSLLTGVVNKKIDNHVGCLVHRLFNVSVPNTDEENWAGNHVSVGDEVILRVSFMDLEARLPYIRSELVETKTKAKKKKIKKEEVTDQDETPTKRKKKANKLMSKSWENSVVRESIKDELDTSVNKKKKTLKKEQSNNTNADLNHESLSDKKKKLKELELRIQKLNNSMQDSEYYQGEEKETRKSTKIKKELNNSKSKKEKNNMNGYANNKNEEIKSLQDSDIMKQIINFDKSKEKKSTKSKEHKPEKESRKISIHTIPTLMADAEDRKTKKRKSSINQNIVWDNKELDLYDSDLEKTLGESPNAEESLKFNLVKIAALNESNLLKRDSNSAQNFKEKKDLKRKRKSNEANGEEQKPKKRKQDSNVAKSEAVKKKSKTKKNN